MTASIDSGAPFDVEISVIIPVFNGARFLPAAINCAREQGMESLEIIVVNDGSTDDTAEAAARFASQIRYFEQNNRGPSAARNHGLEVARGRYIAFLDCDDCWPRNNLQVLESVLVEEPDVDIVMGKTQEEKFDTSANRYVPARDTTFAQSLVAMLTRRSTFDKVGLFDESIRIGEDKDWFIRAVEQKMHIKLLASHVSQLYRRHENNMTNTMAAPETYWLDLLRKSLVRRKALKGESR